MKLLNFENYNYYIITFKNCLKFKKLTMGQTVQEVRIAEGQLVLSLSLTFWNSFAKAKQKQTQTMRSSNGHR